ncbi:hypothetical protein DL95DRAFT_404950 [Leptodontidium sp. 2 PMI_412]|nr:hypothetical protein DL95DRAFT_404950 [Leptodontidium sp. 2 PMI_412]
MGLVELRARISGVLHRYEFGENNPSRDHTFYHSHQPLYTSLETIRLLLGVSGIGLGICNNFHSFVSVAHLYNAIWQTSEMKQRWVAMEEAIAAHVVQLFRGKAPVDRDHIYSRFCLCVGYSATTFARNARKMDVGEDCLLAKAKTLLHPEPIAKLLERYLAGVDNATSVSTSAGKEPKYQINARTSKSQVHSLLDVLSRLRQHLEQSLPLLETEFIRVSAKCSEFLRILHAAFKKRLTLTLDSPDDLLGKFSETDCLDMWKGASEAERQGLRAEIEQKLQTKQKLGFRDEETHLQVL